MTIKEFYELAGGSYDEAMGRLMKEERIIKYLRKYKDDHSYADMLQAYEAHNWENLFTASHTMKGVCYNLSLNALGDAASVICEAVRPGVAPKTDIAPLLEEAKALYNKNIELIDAAISQR